MNAQNLLELLQKEVEAKAWGRQEVYTQKNRVLVEIEAEKLHDCLSALLQQSAFANARLVFAAGSYVGGDLYWSLELASDAADFMLNVRMRIMGATPLSSITDFWPHADWQEKEAQELYGIQFQGQLNVEEPLLLRGLGKQFPCRRH